MARVRCGCDAVRLRPDELDGLSGLSMAGKVSLLHAIGRIDLMEWLKEWGIEALASELDDLGIEEPSHAIDLLPEEIGTFVPTRDMKPHRPLRGRLRCRAVLPSPRQRSCILRLSTSCS